MPTDAPSVSLRILREKGPMTLRRLTMLTSEAMGRPLEFNSVQVVMEHHERLHEARVVAGYWQRNKETVWKAIGNEVDRLDGVAYIEETLGSGWPKKLYPHGGGREWSTEMRDDWKEDDAFSFVPADEHVTVSIACLRAKLKEMELHDDLPDSHDIGYMAAWKEISDWLDEEES